MMGSEKTQGQWGPSFDLANVCIHATLLNNNKILYWGRRPDPTSQVPESLDVTPTTYTLDLQTWKSTETKNQPGANLFCSGHTVRPDGTVFVAGGHILDGVGTKTAVLYDPATDEWTQKAPMTNGRWYPTVLGLPDGSVFVIAGSYNDDETPPKNQSNIVPQIWHPDNTWTDITSNNAFPLYPKVYLDPQGRVFVAGAQGQGQLLDLLHTSADGHHGVWSTGNPAPPNERPYLSRDAGQREYGSSVMYDSGKILYCGGGNDVPPGQENDHGPPTKIVEVIDLNVTGGNPNPKWIKTGDMNNMRRQHFATALPDGTVLVNGGTKGPGFNNLDAGNPIHSAELWNPSTGQWTVMAAEDTDRCYHGTTLLLPDGRIFSAGSGEFGLDAKPPAHAPPNKPADSHINAQIFSPPYLFIEGPQPTIVNAPKEVFIGSSQPFKVQVGPSDNIKTVSLVRNGSVTHTTNMDQSFSFLKFTSQGTELEITPPANENLAPPGYYMLFVLNALGKPSKAAIISLKPPQAPISAVSEMSVRLAKQAPKVTHTAPVLNEKIVAEQSRPSVTVGLTPVCPYGLGPCWGGAFEALKNISDVKVVRPTPHWEDSLAFVYLKDDILPDIDKWRKEFTSLAHGAYIMRGIEMTVSGSVASKDNQLVLAGTSTRPDLVLVPLQAEDKIEWDRARQTPKPPSDRESDAYNQLSAAVASKTAEVGVEVTGRLRKLADTRFTLSVKEFKIVDT